MLGPAWRLCAAFLFAEPSLFVVRGAGYGGASARGAGRGRRSALDQGDRPGDAGVRASRLPNVAALPICMLCIARTCTMHILVRARTWATGAVCH